MRDTRMLNATTAEVFRNQRQNQFQKKFFYHGTTKDAVVYLTIFVIVWLLFIVFIDLCFFFLLIEYLTGFFFFVFNSLSQMKRCGTKWHCISVYTTELLLLFNLVSFMKKRIEYGREISIPTCDPLIVNNGRAIHATDSRHTQLLTYSRIKLTGRR